jgi:hypothetical protein
MPNRLCPHPAIHWLVLLVLFGLASGARADLVKVEAADGTNSSAGDQASVTQLVRSSVSELGGDLTEDGGAADYTLRPHLLRLGESYILSIDKTVKGQIRFSTQLKAAHVDELDKVALRVTRAAMQDKRASADPHVGEITDQEAKEGTQRRPARHTVYLGFGGTWLANLANDNLGYSFGLGYGWDLNRVLLKLVGGLDIAGSAFILSTGIAADVFLTTTEVAPYVGAEFGYAFSKADGGVFSGATANGFDVGIEGGVQILRTAAVNLDIGARAGFLLNSNGLGDPRAISARVGLYF